MKKLTCLLFSIALLSTSSFAQITQGQIAYGGTQTDEGFSVIQTKDGGYATAGYTSSYGAGTYNDYIAAFSNKGQLKWSTVIGGTCLDQAYGIIQDRKGNFVVTGYSCSYAPGSEGVAVIKLDSNGHKIWTEYIGGSSSDQGKCIINTRDGGYAIGGYSLSYGQGAGDFYVIVLDSSGAIKWTKTIGGGGDEEAYTIIQCKDGGFALVGYTMSFGAGNADVYAVKLDSLGNLKWTTSVGGAVGDAGYGICETYDKGYALTGYTSSFGAGSDDVYIIKLDSTGALKWTKTVGGTGNDQGEAIIQTKDSGLVIAGFTDSYGTGGSDVYLVKVSATGTLLWTRAAGGTGNEEGLALVQTSDHGFAVGGYTYSYGDGNGDMYIVKFDSLGNSCSSANDNAGGTEGTGGTAGTGGTVSSGGTIADRDSGRVSEGGILDTVCLTFKKPSAEQNVVATLADVKLYPNPSSTRINVDLSELTINTQLNIEITDITGRVLVSTNVQNPDNVLSFDVSGFNAGMYFMKLSSGNVTEVKKFLKQ